MTFEVGIILALGAAALVALYYGARYDRVLARLKAIKGEAVPLPRSEQVTPSDRPPVNPANAELAEQMSLTRSAMTGWTHQLGDLERTVRLATKEVAQPERNALARIYEGTAADLIDGARNIRRPT